MRKVPSTYHRDLKTSVFGFCTFCFLFISTITNAQVSSSIDSTSIKIGEQIIYKINVKTDSTDLVIFPEGQTFSPLEMIESFETDTVRKRNQFNLIKKYGLTQFDSGRYIIPAQKILIGDKVFATDSIQVIVNPIEVDTVKQGLFDIKPLIKIEKTASNWWIYTLIALLVIALLAGLIYWFVWKKKTLTEEERVALLPPYDRAKLALKQLDESTYLQNSELKEYYSDLTLAIRRYLDEKVYDHALESTTEQLIFRLNLLREGNQIGLSTETIKNLESILKRADLVKFAKSAPNVELAKMDRSTIDLEIDHVKEALPEPSEEEKLLNEQYRLQRVKKEERKKILITSAIVISMLLAVFIGFGFKYGFKYVTDTLIGNDSKELLEGDWVNSAYGIPPIFISTPEVLERQVIPESAEIRDSLAMTTFGLEKMDRLTIAVTTIVLKEEKQDLDPRTYIEGVLKSLEANGASNIITKAEKFVTPNAAEGIKTYGTLNFKKTGSEKVLEGNYVMLAFTSSNKIIQQIIITYLQDDTYADQMVERILNSVELKQLK